MSLMDTPRSNRLHIGLFGKRNSGKSTLMNALTGQSTALVSPTPGTTTDPVYKSIEIHGIGPCLLIDTPGFDDVGPLGVGRISNTQKVAEKIDIALMLFTDMPTNKELVWLERFKLHHTPIIPIISRADELSAPDSLAKAIKLLTNLTPIIISSHTGQGLVNLKNHLINLIPDDYEVSSITGSLAKEGDLILLVMPQDLQAPKGRLILPQVQTLRDLLDKKCLVMSCSIDQLKPALAMLHKAPDLIITDSQVFKAVNTLKPPSSKLTSFSILFAAYKGDLNTFIKGAHAIDSLTKDSKVLIAEACTHVPLSEDIGREKLPHLLKQHISPDLTIQIVSGSTFPDDLTDYDLIIHCGACMFNRKYMLSRINKALSSGIPITNYGVALAYLNHILPHIAI